MKRCTLFFVILFITTQICTSPNNDSNQSPYKNVAKHNLQSLEWEDEDWPEDTFYNFLKFCIKDQCNPQPYKKRNTAFKMLQSIKYPYRTASNPVLDVTTWQDLELLCGKVDHSIYLGSLIDRTETEIGKAMLFYLLSNIITDIPTLINRQKIIQELISNEILFKQLNQTLKQLKKSENIMFSFYFRNDPLKNVSHRNYFNLPLANILDNSSLALEIRNIFSHGLRITNIIASVLATIVLPICGIAQLSKTTIPESITNRGKQLKGSGGPFFSLLSALSEHHIFQGIIATASGIYCGLSLKEEAEWERDNILLETILQKKLMYVASYFKNAQKIEHIINTNPVLVSHLSEQHALSTFFNKMPQKLARLKKIFMLLASKTFKGKPSIFSRRGNILVAYKLLHELKEYIVPIFQAIGEIDAYISMAKLYKEFENKRVKFCFAQYKVDTKPSVEIEQFWNPFIDVNHVVPSSIIMGGTGSIPNNIIVTGPNAGGKSTILKSVVICVTLAQSFGIVPAKGIVITPFAKIATHLNIVDDIASGNSLFKAEVVRAHELLNMVQNLLPGEFCFVLMDEIFNGTSPAEGQAAAFSVAKHLGSYPHAMTMIATHYQILTTLEKETKQFMNYKVSVTCHSDGTISYPFTLERGISDQHIAIDILRLEGFSSTILDTAYALINENTF